MSDVATTTRAVPVWIDLSSSNAEGSRSFYSQLFGWKAEVNPDPQYGGYSVAQLNGKDVAGIGPTQMAEQPTAWTVYIGTADSDATSKKVQAASGTVVVPTMEVGEQGKMTVFQDPSGAFIATWQPGAMPGAQTKGEPNSFAWAELSARGIDKAVPFYKEVFGWDTKTSPFGEGQEYIEWQLDGQSIAGGMEMNPMVPAQVPSYWLVYFATDDVEGMTAKAAGLGANVMMEATPFPGGKFSILGDPQGAAFGLMSMEQGS